MKKNGIVGVGPCDWANVEIFLAGQKIEGISTIESYKDNKPLNMGRFTYEGTITLKKKDARALRKLFYGKRYRLPRKLKKKLKKENLKRLASIMVYYDPASPCGDQCVSLKLEDLPLHNFGKLRTERPSATIIDEID